MTTRILYHNQGEDPAEWLPKLAAALPDAEIRLWKEGDNEPADYALVWHPPEALFQNRKGLKAVFNLAAGVDSLLKSSHVIPPNVPIFRLLDAGMSIQMAEYATYAVLRYYRRFEDYEMLSQHKNWEELQPYKRQDFTIGIMGTGVMGSAVAQSLTPFGFPIKSWSRNKKNVAWAESYFGNDQLNNFLNNVRVLICLLPLTNETTGILNLAHFQQLQPDAYLINLARGAHLVEKDLLKALETGQIKAAMLDVSNEEPLPKNHPFWEHKQITITPHIGGLSVCDETVQQISNFIRAFEQGKAFTLAINRDLGY